MKVLLLTPPFVRGFMRNARWDVITISGAQWYPIYLAYSTGLLEREGHEAKLLDAQVYGAVLGRHPLGESETLDRIKRRHLVDHWRSVYQAGRLQITACVSDALGSHRRVVYTAPGEIATPAVSGSGY